MAFSGNTPTVCWADDTTGDWEIYVRRLENGTWKELGGSAGGGGISDNSSLSRSCAITIGGDGNPQVAWRDKGAGDAQIYARRWTGSSWTPMGSASGGGVSGTNGDSAAPRISYAPNGRTYLSWSDKSTGNYEIYVKQWTGTSWQNVGSDSASGGGISKTAADSQRVTLEYDGSGDLITAWSEGADGGEEIYLKVWTAPAGGSWAARQAAAA